MSSVELRSAAKHLFLIVTISPLRKELLELMLQPPNLVF
jgi:hypothetical protein